MRPLPVLSVAAVLALGAVGCGSSSSAPSASTSAGAAKTTTRNAPEVNPAGDIPDSQAFVSYSPPGGGYAVKVPEGWARTNGTSGAVSFTDKLNRIQMQEVAAKAALTTAEAQRTDIPALAKAVPGFAQPSVSTVKRSAGDAVRITYRAKSPTDPVTGTSHTDAVERYVFFHNGKRIVLTLSGPQGADNVDPWKTVTDSLRYTG